MSQSKKYLCLDIGTVRTGIATAESGVRIAVAYDTIPMNETSFRSDIAGLVTALGVDVIVIGYPRNQSGDATAQSEYVEARANELDDLDAKIVFQDESLTSVLAEQRLKARGQVYEKADIDAEAATIILQDYLEANS